MKTQEKEMVKLKIYNTNYQVKRNKEKKNQRCNQIQTDSMCYGHANLNLACQEKIKTLAWIE